MDDKQPTKKTTTKKKVTTQKKPQDAAEGIAPPVPTDVATGIETVAQAQPGEQERPSAPDPAKFTPGQMLEFNEKDPENDGKRMKTAPKVTEKAPAEKPKAVAPPIPRPAGAPNPTPVSKQVASDTGRVAPALPTSSVLKAKQARTNRRPIPPSANPSGGYLEQRVKRLEDENANLKKQIRTLNSRVTGLSGAVSELADPEKK